MQYPREPSDLPSQPDGPLPYEQYTEAELKRHHSTPRLITFVGAVLLAALGIGLIIGSHMSEYRDDRAVSTGRAD
jgi:hypothetical protein